jgi:hypothetical protein
MCFVVRNSTSLSMLKCRSRYEIELFSERISSKPRNVKLQVQAMFFS